MEKIEQTILEMINHLLKCHPELAPAIIELINANKVISSSDYSFTEIVSQTKSRNELYAFMDDHFKNKCPIKIKEHRDYFKLEKRGFGEDAFHAMWLHLLSEYKPKKCLEIGIYRGQVVTLWGVIFEMMNIESEIHGISPFSSIGDINSTYDDLDYLEDTLSSVKKFNIPAPHFLKALSTEPIAKAYIRSKSWDLIYIDGSHDYDIALSDYELSKENLSVGGLLVMDDSSLYTDYQPTSTSFAGHPGPSRVVNERAMKELSFIGAVGHNNIFLKKNID